MTQYNTLNVTLSNSQLSKLKSYIKNGTEVTLNLSSNLIGNSNDETNLPHKILLTDTKVSKVCKAFANGSSANTKFPKPQSSKMIQSEGSFGIFNPINPFNLIKVLSKIANKAEDLSKKLGLNDIINTVDISKIFIKDFEKFSGTGITLTNNDIKDIIKVIKSLENRGMLIKGTTTKITSQEGRFLNFLKPLIRVGLPLMKNVLTPLAKSVLIISSNVSSRCSYSK